MTRKSIPIALILLAQAAVPAAGQIPVLPLPRVGAPPVASDALMRTGELTREVAALATTRLDRLTALVRANPRVLDTDERGAAVVRGEVLVTDPSDASVAAAKRLGFTVVVDETDPVLGLRVVRLRAPEGLRARSAIKRLRALDPAGSYEFNHIYSAAGAASAQSVVATTGNGPRIGLIDGGVVTGSGIDTRGFAGAVVPLPHAAHVAAILLAAAPGAHLHAADVYGGRPEGGNAAALVRGFGWLAAQGVGVVNISLVGPPNAVLRAAIAALARRNILVVAPVGNGGPAAPPLYPASYPEVVAVTGVDVRDRVLVEAGRASHVDFAAPGLALAAAPGARGTSFAAPVVAGLLARGHPTAATVNIQSPVTALALSAVDLGKRGVDPVYGRGLVGAEFRSAAKK